MSDDVRDRYDNFMQDEDLNALRDNIALIDTRISILTEHLDDTISSASLASLSKLWNRFMRAVRDGDPGAQAASVTDIDMFIKDNIRQYSVWDDITRLTESRRKLSESEHKRLEQNKQLLTIEQAMLLLQLIVVSVKEVAHLYADEETAKHIIDGTAQAYSELVGGSAENSDTGAVTVFRSKRK